MQCVARCGARCGVFLSDDHFLIELISDLHFKDPRTENGYPGTTAQSPLGTNEGRDANLDFKSTQRCYKIKLSIRIQSSVDPEN